MNHKTKKILYYAAPIALFAGLFFIFSDFSYAQDSLGGEWDKYLKNVLPDFSGNAVNASGEDLAAGLVRRAIATIKNLIGIVALIIGIIYAVQLIFSQGKEEAITKAKQNFLWLLIGFVVLMVSEGIANIFNPETATSEALISFSDGTDKLREITNYIKWFFGSIIVMIMTISGIRMITAGGKEETLTKEKNHLIWSGIGMLVVLLASNIVNAIYVVNNPNEIVAGDSKLIVTEIGSVIRLILTFLGPMAILFTIYAGYQFLTSFGNEDSVKKAKTMITAGITGIAIIYGAFAIVNTFLTAPLIPTP